MLEAGCDYITTTDAIGVVLREDGSPVSTVMLERGSGCTIIGAPEPGERMVMVRYGGAQCLIAAGVLGVPKAKHDSNARRPFRHAARPPRPGARRRVLS